MEKKSIFNELTGIRAIAAYMVFFHHFLKNLVEIESVFVRNMINELHIGVTMFFVLSGFLIAYRYYDNVKLTDNKWIVKYIQNRVARVYPMYFLVTCFTFGFIFYNSQNFIHDFFIFIANITFVRGFFSDFLFSGVGQGWSLTVEECFYFTAPIIFLLSKRMKLFIPFLGIFLVGVILWLIFRNINFYNFMSSFRFWILYTYFGRVFEFFIGISLALAYKNRTTFVKLNLYGLKTSIGALSVILAVVALALLKGELQFGLLTYWGMAINNILLPLGVALLYLGLITENTFLKKILATKLFVILGKSSYTFYLIHIGTISYFLFQYITSNIWLIFIFINILSVGLFFIVEEPLNNKIRKMNWYDFLSSKKKLFLKNKISTN